MSILEEKLTKLVAKEFGISPDEVTIDYIHRWRESSIYPAANFDFNGKYGGYRHAGLEVLTTNEIEAIIKTSEDFLAQFATA